MCTKITFIVDGNDVEVAYDKAIKSELVSDMLSLSCNSDCKIVFPTKYLSLAIIYTNFLNDTNVVTITDKQVLLLCFDMESYFAHDEFFDYLISQLLTSWSKLFSVAFSITNPDLKRKIMLQLPYDLIPSEPYMNNPLFFKQWIKTQHPLEITVDSKKVYHKELDINSKSQKLQLNIYRTDVNKTSKLTWYRIFELDDDNNVISERSYYNGVPEGTWRVRDSLGNLVPDIHYDKGVILDDTNQTHPPLTTTTNNINTNHNVINVVDDDYDDGDNYISDANPNVSDYDSDDE